MRRRFVRYRWRDRLSGGWSFVMGTFAAVCVVALVVFAAAALSAQQPEPEVVAGESVSRPARAAVVVAATPVPPKVVVVFQPPPPTPPTDARLGQRVESGNIVLQTISVVKRTELESAIRAPAGRIYLVTQVELINQRNQPLPYAPNDFRVRSSDGVEHLAMIPVGSGGIRGGQLRPGGRVEGSVAFEVGVAERGFVLMYAPPLGIADFQTIMVALGD